MNSYNNLRDSLKNAAILREKGQNEESLKILKSFVTKPPFLSNSELHSGIGLSYKGLGKLGEAIKAFNHALKLNPKDAFASNSLGNIYADLGKPDEALKWFDVSIKAKANNFASYNAATMLLWKTNQLEKAIEYGKEVLEKKDYFYTKNFKNRFGEFYLLPASEQKKSEDFSIKNKKRRIISFSLFGDDSAYWSGAIENAILIDQIFCGWTGRFYCDKSIPKYVLAELLKRGSEVFMMPKNDGFSGTFWRFFAANDQTIDYFIIRDADARLNSQDRVAVDEWIESGKSFHIMRDHPVHAELIMGGMWGGKAGLLPNLVDVLNKFYRGKGNKFFDQRFLAEFVWPLIRTESLTHDQFFQYGTSAKKFSNKGKLIFPCHVGAGFKNKKQFFNYAENMEKQTDNKDLLELTQYPNFRSLVPLSDLKSVFSNIYKNNLWGNTESKSGPGSSLKEAEPVILWMKKNLAKLGIKRIVDAGCGDFNWMQYIILNSEIKYTGFDIVEELIKRNQQLYGSKNINFKVKNICQNSLPTCDLLIIRHCLFHLSFRDLDSALKNISLTKYKYLLTDTHILEDSFQNKDIISGGFRLINLYSEPLNFKENKVLDKIREGYNVDYPKDLLLFNKKHVPTSLNIF